MALGMSFSPVGEDRERMRPGGGAGMSGGGASKFSPQEAIRILSLRIPRTVGGGAPAPPSLLTSMGSAGLPAWQMAQMTGRIAPPVSPQAFGQLSPQAFGQLPHFAPQMHMGPAGHNAGPRPARGPSSLMYGAPPTPAFSFSMEQPSQGGPTVYGGEGQNTSGFGGAQAASDDWRRALMAEFGLGDVMNAMHARRMGGGF